MTPKNRRRISPCNKQIIAAKRVAAGWATHEKSPLETEFFDLVVVVLAVKNVPLLRPFNDDLPLRCDLLSRGGVDLGLLQQQLFKSLAGLLPNGVSVFEEVDLLDLREGVGYSVGEFIELVAR